MTATNAGLLLATARRQAGLSQRALASRARTCQSVVARIESGATSPTWATLQHLLRKAGFELQATAAPKARGRTHMLDDVARILRLTPEQRLIELRNSARFYAGAVRVIDERV
jgi:transcriptional regulator with XRE-family HTH domain